MKVFILGASGFIGLPAAQALVRAGHTVYALARTEATAKKLTAEEIIPIIGDATAPDSWISIVAEVDAVIDALGAGDMKSFATTLLDAITKTVAAKRSPLAPKLTFIYTSGTWVHGDDRNNLVSDSTPADKPSSLVAWRPEHEQNVIKSQNLNGIVIRPTLLYGRSASIVGMYFAKAAKTGVASWPGTEGGSISLIHCDDLADLYVRVTENGLKVGGVIFDAANDISEPTNQFLAKLAKISGAKSWEYSKPENAFEEALAATSLLRPYLGRALLGWRPLKAGLTDNLEVYYNAWKATQQ